jgi:phytoene/squalene synthetase
MSRVTLARSITRSGSRQTHFVIGCLADRDLRDDAFRAYAYFRWLDDQLDGDGLSPAGRLAFLERQRRLLASTQPAVSALQPTEEERLLVDLLRTDDGDHPGLRSYVRHMMAVMELDARRRGRTITRQELDSYTRDLSRAVMDGLSYFVGHRAVYPATPDRLLAATGAHIVHMLRDAPEDVRAGYYNVPREFLAAHRLSPQDLEAAAYEVWSLGRLRLARRCFARGRVYILSVGNLRARLAGLAYCGRFESTLRRLENRLRVSAVSDAAASAALGMRGLRASRARWDGTS